jgi:hypothetical protein
MIFFDQLVAEFPVSPIPAAIIAPSFIGSPDECDVNAFLGKRWIDVNLDLWKNHYDAIFGFNIIGFKYYLPSLIRETLNNNEDSIMAIDAILNILNTSVDENIWDDFFYERFSLFNIRQLRIIQNWAERVSQFDTTISEIDNVRIFLTLERLIELKSL